MTDLTKAAILTKYPVDKIVGVFEGRFVAGTGPYTSRVYSLGTMNLYAIAHGFGRPVFCEMQWSLDNGYSWSDSGGGAATSGYESIAFSDSTYIYILVPNGLIGSSPNAVFQYRILATWIDDYDTTNPNTPPISTLGQPTSFNSTNNVPKIYKQGVVNVSTSSGVVVGVFSTVPHDLGGYQNYKVHIEAFPGEVWPQNFGGSSNAFYFDGNQIEAQSFMSTTELAIDTNIKSSHGTRKVFYRIYGDV